MLIDLLTLLKDKKTYSLEELSMKLNTSAEHITASLDFLERQNYIKKLVLECDSSAPCVKCSACPKGKTTPNMTIWEVIV